MARSCGGGWGGGCLLLVVGLVVGWWWVALEAAAGGMQRLEAACGAPRCFVSAPPPPLPSPPSPEPFKQPQMPATSRAHLLLELVRRRRLEGAADKRPRELALRALLRLPRGALVGRHARLARPHVVVGRAACLLVVESWPAPLWVVAEVAQDAVQVGLLVLPAALLLLLLLLGAAGRGGGPLLLRAGPAAAAAAGGGRRGRGRRRRSLHHVAVAERPLAAARHDAAARGASRRAVVAARPPLLGPCHRPGVLRSTQHHRCCVL